MVSFDPSEEQRILIGSTLNFALKDLRLAGEAGQLTREVIDTGLELGLLQASIRPARARQ